MNSYQRSEANFAYHKKESDAEPAVSSRYTTIQTIEREKEAAHEYTQKLMCEN